MSKLKNLKKDFNKQLPFSKGFIKDIKHLSMKEYFKRIRKELKLTYLTGVTTGVSGWGLRRRKAYAFNYYPNIKGGTARALTFLNLNPPELKDEPSLSNYERSQYYRKKYGSKRLRKYVRRMENHIKIDEKYAV